MTWTALAGGVGGAKLARGLAALAGDVGGLDVAVNTGDDFTHLGLRISPDVDTVLYTVAGLANPATGWGLAGDTTTMLEQLGRLGGPTWFWLGDRDLATHLVRTARLAAGATLTEVTAQLAAALGVPPGVHVLPMSDDPVATEVQTPDGWLAFQDYFVRRQHRDPVRGVRFVGVERAQPSPAMLTALREAEAVIICPSNPIVSVGPILALPGVRDVLAGRGNRVAVSPIVGGRALKGPADTMLAGLGHAVSALGVARLYQGLVDVFVLDETDAALALAVADLGMRPVVAPTVMQTLEESIALARIILEALG